jgi:hypothetical protein
VRQFSNETRRPWAEGSASQAPYTPSGHPILSNPLQDCGAFVQEPVGFIHIYNDTLCGINIQYLFIARHLHPTPNRAKARPANESPAFTLV